MKQILVIPLLISLLAIPMMTHYASAHVEKNFGNIYIKVGLTNEPPLVGDTNTVQIFIDTVSGNTTTPISQTGLDNMTVVITYGGLQNTLKFTPNDDTPDEYDTTIIPTKIGSYQIIMNGTINGQTINAGFPLDEVEDKSTYYQPAGSFPPSNGASSSQSTPTTSDQTYANSQVINQLSSEISKAANDANVAAQGYANVAKSFEEVKNTTDMLFMISIVGIGVGVAGVVIAVVAITRKN
ncbi:MAG: hypothetical protein KGH89_06995 [Thaumarchaeota archaeon]|nr:hypothetical protein [Nitrososphaerota archaeon]MDE1866762.1 hypothetical protein [Nitrososphaerota archaeon]